MVKQGKVDRNSFFSRENTKRILGEIKGLFGNYKMTSFHGKVTL